MHSEMDTDDCPEKSVPTDSSLRISSARMDEIIRSYQVIKQAALHAKRDKFVNPNITSHDVASQSHRPYGNGSITMKSGPKYDPESLMPKRMICSEDVNRHRLIPRKEKIRIFDFKSSTNEEDDEAFFERLRQRIVLDIKNKVRNGPEIPLPKRSSSVKKRKTPFTNDSLNLMKKFRSHFEDASVGSSSTIDNGIFSLANKPDDENQVNVDSHQTTMETDAIIPEIPRIFSPMQEIETFTNNVLNEEIDSEFICPTPVFVPKTDVEPET